MDVVGPVLPGCKSWNMAPPGIVGPGGAAVWRPDLKEGGHNSVARLPGRAQRRRGGAAQDDIMRKALCGGAHKKTFWFIKYYGHFFGPL